MFYFENEHKEFHEWSFRSLRALYECAVDDLVLCDGSAFDPTELIWERLPRCGNHVLTATLLYRGEPVLWYETNDQEQTFQARIRLRSRVN